MAFQYTLQKILDMKEKEKQQQEIEYTKALHVFEEKATELYNLLKQKEEVEESCRLQLQKGISIYEIRLQQRALSLLHNEIERVQHTTNIARDHMYRKQHELMVSSVEAKKYEKLKDIKKEEYLMEQKRLDTKLMDEISLQSYVNR